MFEKRETQILGIAAMVVKHKGSLKQRGFPTCSFSLTILIIYFQLTVEPLLFSFKQCTCASGPFLPGIVLAKQRPMNEHSRITPSNCCGSRKSTNLSFSFSFVKMPNVSFRHLPVKSMTGSYQIDN